MIRSSIENVKLKVRNRLVELKLTFEFANHIMDNYIRYHSTHDLDFLQIQKLSRNCIWEHVKGRTYRGAGSFKDSRYLLVVILTPKFAVLKTCYKTRG